MPQIDRRTADEKTAGIARLIEPTLNGLGYELVRVQIGGGRAGTPVLQVMAERRDGQAMTVEDCADISRSLSALLDVEDPIAGAYTLEVSSPGIDRPLVREGDFERFAGHVAKVETAEPVGGRKRFRGRLRGVAEGNVLMTLDDGAEVAVPLSAVSRAKLVLTDELIAQHLKQ